MAMNSVGMPRFRTKPEIKFRVITISHFPSASRDKNRQGFSKLRYKQTIGFPYQDKPPPHLRPDDAPANGVGGCSCCSLSAQVPISSPKMGGLPMISQNINHNYMECNTLSKFRTPVKKTIDMIPGTY